MVRRTCWSTTSCHCVFDGGDTGAIAGHPMAKAALEAALLDLALQRAGRRLAD